MLTVKTSLKEFKGKGIGLVAEEFIKKGRVVWTFNPIVDILLKKKDVPKGMEEFYETYAVKRSKDRLFLNTDNARFINHSKNPNTKSLGAEKENIAVREIKPGEEITINYEQIEQPIDFEDFEVKK